ncbi:MAG: PhzF family phenazine biosynthesis protein [Methyloligellaceae bacterium]
MNSERRFYTLDVFSSQKLQGNPLAVVLDSEGLSDLEMQTIAREFNLSETVFILPAEYPENTARLRIFTPGQELPFAGHPTIGASVLLAHTDPANNTVKLNLELKAGLINSDATCNDGLGEAGFHTPGVPSEYTPHNDPEVTAKLLGLTADDLKLRNHLPGFVSSSGNEWLFIPVKDARTIKRAKVDMAYWSAAHAGHTSDGVYVYTDECNSPDAHWHTRMFAPAMGITEDPATGSAAVTFPGILAEFETLVQGENSWQIEQGYEMGQPSQLHVSARVDNSNILHVKLAGSAVILMSGTLYY